MKKLLYLSCALFLMITVIASCDKQQLAPLFVGKLVTSSMSINPNEVDSLMVVGAENEKVTWSITPVNNSGTYTIVKQENNKLLVKFSDFGVYNVTATINGKSQTLGIGCWDNGFYTQIPLTDATIALTPHYYQSKTNSAPDSVSFVFDAKIMKAMACSNEGLNYRVSRSDNNFTLVFIDYNQPDAAHCTPPNANSFYQLSFGFAQDPGYQKFHINTTYPLTVKVGNLTYTGSFKLSTTAMDIVWNYTTGVIMSTTHIPINN